MTHYNVIIARILLLITSNPSKRAEKKFCFRFASRPAPGPHLDTFNRENLWRLKIFSLLIKFFSSSSSVRALDGTFPSTCQGPGKQINFIATLAHNCVDETGREKRLEVSEREKRKISLNQLFFPVCALPWWGHEIWLGRRFFPLPQHFSSCSIFVCLFDGKTLSIDTAPALGAGFCWLSRPPPARARDFPGEKSNTRRKTKEKHTLNHN